MIEHEPSGITNPPGIWILNSALRFDAGLVVRWNRPSWATNKETFKFLGSDQKLSVLVRSSAATVPMMVVSS